MSSSRLVSCRPYAFSSAKTTRSLVESPTEVSASTRVGPPHTSAHDCDGSLRIQHSPSTLAPGHTVAATADAVKNDIKSG